MSNTQNGQNQSEGTEAPMPSENKPAEDTQPTQSDGMSERTAEQFEKLKAHNKKLAEENASLKGSSPQGSVLDDLRPNIPTNTQTPAVVEPFVDDEGIVDTALLNMTLAEAKKQADEARRIAAQSQADIQRFQETEQVRAAHAAFPQLDPNNIEKFDPKFYNLVKNELIGQMMAGEQDVMKAAAKAADLYQPVVTTQPSQIPNREQASAPTGASKRQSAATTHDELVAGTMRGDSEAIFKRVQASGN